MVEVQRPVLGLTEKTVMLVGTDGMQARGIKAVSASSIVRALSKREFWPLGMLHVFDRMDSTRRIRVSSKVLSIINLPRKKDVLSFWGASTPQACLDLRPLTLQQQYVCREMGYPFLNRNCL
jgi:hypothetical protein